MDNQVGETTRWGSKVGIKGDVEGKVRVFQNVHCASTEIFGWLQSLEDDDGDCLAELFILDGINRLLKPFSRCNINRVAQFLDILLQLKLCKR